jgi:hypothetical protein
MFPSRARAWWSTISAGLIMSAFAVVSPAASADETIEECSLRSNPDIAAQHEWFSCMSVDAGLSVLPAVGESALLTFDVRAQFDRAEVRIDSDLPAGLEWEQPPAGMETSTVPGPGGELRRATGVVSFAAGETRRFEGRIRATAAGPADIAVRVFAPTDGEIDAPTDHVYLTVAERGGTSVPGMAGRAESTAVPGQPGATRVTPDLPHKPAGVATLARPSTRLTSTACVSGSWGYVDSNMVQNRLAPNFTVEVWDDDTFGNDELLAVHGTDGLGAYNVCFGNDDIDGGFDAAGQDVFVRFRSENTLWRVQETGTGVVFQYDTGIATNLTDGGTHDFGFLVPADPLHHRGIQAFDAVNDFWTWIPSQCWDANDQGGTCPPVVVNWRWDSVIGTFYDPNSRQIFLMADDPKSRDATVHEATHAVMDDVYEFSPVPGAGGPHNIHTVSSQGMAWVEGFAEWTPIRVYNDPNFNWPNGQALNLETPTWGSMWGVQAWANGDAVEGRVAGALIDLSDSTNEAPWDRLAEGSPGNIWSTFLNHKSNTMGEFWGQRSFDGFNVAPTGGLASLYQNTIDYTFRDPLSDNVAVSRPSPLVPHNFSYNTTTQFWSAVAVRPQTGTDHDLALFDNHAQTIQLASSAASSSAVDFVAVNSNGGKQPLGDFYPRVTKFSGTGTCSVELAQGSSTLLAASSHNIPMASTKVVAVRDTTLVANVAVTIKVTPGSATQDVELFLVSPNPGAGQPANIRTRAMAFKSATAGGPGVAETITFTPTAAQAGRYGVVVINKAGSGTVNLQRP